ncbi:MBL fold metallo-hydrolase [Pseudorhodoferax sp. Leaf267]|uniref:MBL fold metallo-hydrolase n=1 Tax=Pseudorhodoferax sp. Leaf267 TaxID=1736316 RepID=UPI0006F1CECE|nr:MBL fold metallo-hydrolase [Pseudorhodoferax sp. Leaf267]KQP13686.1 MBL fold metallo-hydrolase [Pseudorhodoferax sp. Leaf267]
MFAPRLRFFALAAVLLLTGCATTRACGPGLAASPQFQADGCRFANVANPDAKPSQEGWRIWSRFFFGTKEGTVPVDAIPVRPLTRAQLDALPIDANHIVRLGHSSHLLKLQGRYWLIDPVFAERVSPFSFLGPKRFHAPPIAREDLPPIEGLLLSHDHYDHLDLSTIEYLKGRVQRYFVPLGVGARLRDAGVPADRIAEFDWWQSATHADVQLTSTPSQHFSGRGLTDRDSTLWTSWVIEAGGQRIYFSGDSGYFGGFKQIGERFGGFDIALIENGAYDPWWPSVHLSPEESIRAFEDLRGKTLYSVHNSTFDLAFHRWQAPMTELAALARARGIALATPEIGEVLTVGATRENRLWWEGLR